MKYIKLILLAITVFWYTNDGATKQIFYITEPITRGPLIRFEMIRSNSDGVFFRQGDKVLEIRGGMIKIERGRRLK